MDETLTELSGPEAEIENLLAGHSSPEGLKPRFVVEENRDVGDKVKVYIVIWQDPGQPRERYLSIFYPDPEDDTGRKIDEHYDLTARHYKKTRIPARNDWIASQSLGAHDMTEEDDVLVQQWLDKFKAAPARPESEVIDDKNKKD